MYVCMYIHIVVYVYVCVCIYIYIIYICTFFSKMWISRPSNGNQSVFSQSMSMKPVGTLRVDGRGRFTKSRGTCLHGLGGNRAAFTWGSKLMFLPYFRGMTIHLQELWVNRRVPGWPIVTMKVRTPWPHGNSEHSSRTAEVWCCMRVQRMTCIRHAMAGWITGRDARKMVSGKSWDWYLEHHMESMQTPNKTIQET